MRLLVRMIMCTMVYLYKRTGWLGVNLIGGDSTTEEGGAKVESNAGEPDIVNDDDVDSATTDKADQIMKIPKATHCGPSFRILRESGPTSSRTIGESLSTQVSKLTWS